MQLNENIFPKKYVDRNFYLKIYALVCSRCFSLGKLGTALVPMADMLNHSSEGVTNEIVSTRYQLDGL